MNIRSNVFPHFRSAWNGPRDTEAFFLKVYCQDQATAVVLLFPGQALAIWESRDLPAAHR